MDANVTRRRSPAALTGMRKVNIHIGGLFVSGQPVVIQTLLGSCVAACLYDPSSGIGGMNHILLPGKTAIGQFDHSARYGINAMELLINEIMKMGGKRKKLISKVFGGGHIISSINENISPGPRNARFVMEFLATEGIPVTGRDTGGYNARRVYFRTDTGDVYLKRVPALRLPTIAAKERKHREKIEEETKRTGKITFFE